MTKIDWANKPEDMEVWVESLDKDYPSDWHRLTYDCDGDPSWEDKDGLIWSYDSENIIVHRQPEFIVGDKVQTSIGVGVIVAYVHNHECIMDDAIVQLDDCWMAIPKSELSYPVSMKDTPLKDVFIKNVEDINDSVVVQWFIDNANDEMINKFMEEHCE